MYCQSCGTQNPEDANFCKTCGTGIARPGDKGGPIVDEGKAGPAPGAAAAQLGAGADTIKDEGPPPGVSLSKDASGKVDVQTTLAGLRSRSTSSLTNMSLSLVTMSVRSPARTYLVVAAIILALIGVGAVAAYGVMLVYSANTAVIVTTTSPLPAALPPVEVGLPEVGGDGSQVADLASGAPGRGRQASNSPSAPGRDASPPNQEGSPPPTKTSSGAGSTAASGGADPPRASSTTVEGPAEGSSSGSSGGQTNPASSTGGQTSPPTSGSGGTTPPPSPPGLEEGVEERDIEMDMYAGQVRRVIRQYYAARAQSCFDRATRNNQNLRGTVVVQFTIGAGGTVRQSSVVRNTTGEEELGGCIAGQVLTWRLPAPPGDAPVTMQMPFSW